MIFFYRPFDRIDGIEKKQEYETLTGKFKLRRLI